MADDSTPRTAAATAARRRQGEEARAKFLRERGWTCTPPESRPASSPDGRPAQLEGQLTLPTVEHENTNRA